MKNGTIRPIIKNHIYNNLYNNFISYTHTETLYNINEKLKKRKKKGENKKTRYQCTMQIPRTTD